MRIWKNFWWQHYWLQWQWLWESRYLQDMHLELLFHGQRNWQDICLSWSGFISVSYCTKKCISIKIEQFVAMFPRRGKALFKVVNHTIELALVFISDSICSSLSKECIWKWTGKSRMSDSNVLYSGSPLFSFVLVAFRIIQRWIIEFKIVIRKDEEKGGKINVSSSRIFTLLYLSDHCNSISIALGIVSVPTGAFDPSLQQADICHSFYVGWNW